MGVMIEVRGVHELSRLLNVSAVVVFGQMIYAYLLSKNACNTWVAVAKRIDGNPSCEIKVFPVFDIPHEGIPHPFQTWVVAGHMLVPYMGSC